MKGALFADLCGVDGSTLCFLRCLEKCGCRVCAAERSRSSGDVFTVFSDTYGGFGAERRGQQIGRQTSDSAGCTAAYRASRLLFGTWRICNYEASFHFVRSTLQKMVDAAGADGQLEMLQDDSLAQNIALSLELHTLISSSSECSIEDVKALIDRGAAAWIQDDEGWSALHHAASMRCSLLARMRCARADWKGKQMLD